jgi:hypothetical protein
MAGTIDFVQCIYKQEQQAECYPFARIYFNHKLTHFFENTMIAAEVLSSDANKISVCSWKLRQKMKWYIGKHRPIADEIELPDGTKQVFMGEALKTDYDVLSFTRNTQYHQMLAAADKWHPGFRGIMKKILEAIGQKMPSEIKNAIYQNHFAARADIYKAYVNDWLVPAMNIMDKDPEISKLCWQDSKYSNLAKKDAATPEYLQEKIGVPYYPLHPFLLERLFSIFCHNNKIKVDYL